MGIYKLTSDVLVKHCNTPWTRSHRYARPKYPYLQSWYTGDWTLSRSPVPTLRLTCPAKLSNRGLSRPHIHWNSTEKEQAPSWPMTRALHVRAGWVAVTVDVLFRMLLSTSDCLRRPLRALRDHVFDCACMKKGPRGSISVADTPSGSRLRSTSTRRSYRPTNVHPENRCTSVFRGGSTGCKAWFVGMEEMRAIDCGVHGSMISKSVDQGDVRRGDVYLWTSKRLPICESGLGRTPLLRSWLSWDMFGWFLQWKRQGLTDRSRNSSMMERTEDILPSIEVYHLVIRSMVHRKRNCPLRTCTWSETPHSPAPCELRSPPRLHLDIPSRYPPQCIP